MYLKIVFRHFSYKFNPYQLHPNWSTHTSCTQTGAPIPAAPKLEHPYQLHPNQLHPNWSTQTGAPKPAAPNPVVEN